MPEYVEEYPPGLLRIISDDSKAINKLGKDGRFAEVEEIFARQYRQIRDMENRLPDNRRFHKGATLHNWGISILLQKNPDRVGEGFEKVLLAYIEDLFDEDDLGQVRSLPAYRVLTENPFFDKNLIDNTIRIAVENRKETGEIPKDAQTIVTSEIRDAIQAGILRFVGNRQRVVFVVHGRNLKALDSLVAFLKSIGLVPITFTQAVPHVRQGAPYTFDVLGRAFSLAHAVIVFLTPDDKGCLKRKFRKKDDLSYETRPTGQARLNVIFEAGMALGGTFRDKTILVELGVLRPFSDIGGMITVRLKNEISARQNLINRLRAINCAVTLTGNDWQTTGDFEGVIEDDSNFLQKLASRLLSWLFL